MPFMLGIVQKYNFFLNRQNFAIFFYNFSSILLARLFLLKLTLATHCHFWHEAISQHRHCEREATSYPVIASREAISSPDTKREGTKAERREEKRNTDDTDF